MTGTVTGFKLSDCFASMANIQNDGGHMGIGEFRAALARVNPAELTAADRLALIDLLEAADNAQPMYDGLVPGSPPKLVKQFR